jgi:hypothetical protein
VAPTPVHMRPTARRRLPPLSALLGMCCSRSAARPRPASASGTSAQRK